LRCEVCGRKIHDNPNRVIIEGAKLTVCNGCAKLGKATWEEPAKPTVIPQSHIGASHGTPMQGPIQIRKRIITAKVDTSQEMTEGYGEIIRQAREKLGLSVEDLGMKINEKASVLRKIELGKISPDNLLVSKLERVMKIKLLSLVSEEKTPQNIPKTVSRELTLGDLMPAKQKDKKEGPAKRKPS
jgi:putative transcription factor